MSGTPRPVSSIQQLDGQIDDTASVRPSETAMCVDVCHVDDLTPERGVAALVAGEQVALFRLFDGDVLAVQQEDPYSGSHVMSRGLVGTRGEVPTVASPMFKQVFDLRTGRCLEPMGKEPRDLCTWAVRVDGSGRVLVDALPRSGGVVAGGSVLGART